jgi:lipopolysaccharide transport system ATP-binding protein
MSDTIISVENLGKKYRISHQGERQRYVALRDVIAQKCAAPFRALFGKNGRVSPLRKDSGDYPKRTIKQSPALALNNVVREGQAASSKEDFWALKGVSFEVKQGEVVGILGRNGAGKSTLLKILSRITEPSEGRVVLKGRVASLLEVGTGFHPELTGRENIFLNSAILGMTRAETKLKFDEIVAFSEVGKFLDTPVKRYSSGMYVRLAFAVAAHLEPEILIVDEVLAVGDAQFQKKCLGKMQDVATKEGRTVLFVSHNMGAISELCSKAITLDAGRLLSSGDVEVLISDYLQSGASQSGFVQFNRVRDKPRTLAKAFFHSAAILNHLGQTTSSIDVKHGFSVELVYEVVHPIRNLEVSIRIITSDGRPVMTSMASEAMPEIVENEQLGVNQARVKVPGMFLMPGHYMITIGLFEPCGEVFDSHEATLRVDIQDTGTVFTRYQLSSHIFGVVINPLDWQVETIEAKDRHLSLR